MGGRAGMMEGLVAGLLSHQGQEPQVSVACLCGGMLHTLRERCVTWGGISGYFTKEKPWGFRPHLYFRTMHACVLPL